MTERFCRQKVLGSCLGCPNLELVKPLRMRNPDVEPSLVVKAVGIVLCPVGVKPQVSSAENIRRISSDRRVGR